MMPTPRTAYTAALTAKVAGAVRVANPPPVSSVVAPMDVVAAGAYPPAAVRALD